jgi:hypothetical protein
MRNLREEHCVERIEPRLKGAAVASVFAANPEKNPTLTNIALSWRTSDGIVESFRRKEIA